MLDRAYALLEVKSILPELRQFSGVASTPALDRQGDSVDPMGLTFRNPVPLLLHHDQSKPIGSVILTATPDGLNLGRGSIVTALGGIASSFVGSNDGGCEVARPVACCDGFPPQ